MNAWSSWIRVNLQFITRHTISCVVKVDYKDHKETLDVLKDSFPAGFQRVRTQLADEFMKPKR